MKKLLIGIFFMMFLVNSIPRANAASVELEFSNGMTVSFDDTITKEFIYESRIKIRYYKLTPTYVLHPLNPINPVKDFSVHFSGFDESIDSNTYSRVIFGSYVYDDNGTFMGSNVIRSYKNNVKFNNNIVTSLVDVIDDVSFLYQYTYRYDSGELSSQRSGFTKLTNVTVDGISQTSTVPTPPTIWLMGTAIAGLLVRKKIIA